jgi:N6-adenosine-specific RNA methylase IME4
MTNSTNAPAGRSLATVAPGGLPSIEKARSLLTQCRSVHEVMKIKALAQAVASCANAEGARDEAAAIVLLAKARIGDLTAAIPKGQPKPGSRAEPGSAPKREALEAEGISRKEAAECEKIAGLARSGDLDRLIESGATTTAAAVAVANLSAAAREDVLEKLGEEADVRKAIGAAKRAERMDKLAEISKGEAPLTGALGRFPVIYADPPWRYEHVETESRAIENQYPTMALDSICALPVSEIATPDAVLFCWATSPKLEEALRVVREWGFTYRTCMVWDKLKIGMGYYARQRHELLLIATRGQPPTPAPADRPESVIAVERGKHSAKPERFYELIERMYPEFKRVEMFCRSPREGWTAWGNQA